MYLLKKILLAVLTAVLSGSILFFSCMSVVDPARERSKYIVEQIRIHPADWNYITQLHTEQRKEVEKFIADYGRVPHNMDELKEAGYKVYNPYPKYYWLIVSMDGVHFNVGLQFDPRQIDLSGSWY